jgi:diacylglycerol kinase family enzyme
MVGQRLPQLEVEADGFKLQTLFALTSRVRNYGGDLTIAAGASLLSSEFQLVTFEGSTTWRYPVYLTGALFGKVGHFPGVHMIRAKRIRFAPLNGSPVLAQLDGEPAGALPAVAEMVPDALTLLLPATYGNAAQ